MNEEKITTSDNKKLSPEEIKRVKGLGCLQDLCMGYAILTGTVLRN